MGRKFWRGLAFGCLTLGAAGAVSAAAADAISARHANFKAIAKANKGIADELKNPSPSMTVIQTNAKAINTLASQIPSWFPAGSGPESGAKTHALPAIWQKNADFRKAAANLAAAAGKVNAAAASGNAAQVRAAFPAVGAACKACHDNFRARD